MAPYGADFGWGGALDFILRQGRFIPVTEGATPAQGVCCCHARLKGRSLPTLGLQPDIEILRAESECNQRGIFAL